ncbi:MAG: alkylglycerol monooxygenase, partial [Paracoccaceae bacterium]
MNYVAYAVPFFLLLIVLEIGWGLLRKNNTYRVNDSLNSLSLGMLSTLTKLIVLNVGMVVFVHIENHYTLTTLDNSSLLHWALGLLAYDFCYYWFHRISHERTLFWGSHVVHHQSEDFNLSTALRQTSTGVFATWVFYVPLFFLGMPIEMYVSIASVHLIYQFWIHTQFLPKLGPLEWFLITPSNHRVHHAQNTYYVDKNYGGLLCVWDRLFGTFREEREDEPIIYGITTPLNTWSPIWANLHIFTGMLRDAFYTQKLSDKFRILYARTGWRPDDVKQRFPDAKSDLQHFRKFDPILSRSNKVTITLQYFVATVCYFWLVTSAAQLT